MIHHWNCEGNYLKPFPINCQNQFFVLIFLPDFLLSMPESFRFTKYQRWKKLWETCSHNQKKRPVNRICNSKIRNDLDLTSIRKQKWDFNRDYLKLFSGKGLRQFSVTAKVWENQSSRPPSPGGESVCPVGEEKSSGTIVLWGGDSRSGKNFWGGTVTLSCGDSLCG